MPSVGYLYAVSSLLVFVKVGNLQLCTAISSYVFACYIPVCLYIYLYTCVYVCFVCIIYAVAMRFDRWCLQFIEFEVISLLFVSCCSNTENLHIYLHTIHLCTYVPCCQIYFITLLYEILLSFMNYKFN